MYDSFPFSAPCNQSKTTSSISVEMLSQVSMREFQIKHQTTEPQISLVGSHSGLPKLVGGQQPSICSDNQRLWFLLVVLPEGGNGKHESLSWINGITNGGISKRAGKEQLTSSVQGPGIGSEHCCPTLHHWSSLCFYPVSTTAFHISILVIGRNTRSGNRKAEIAPETYAAFLHASVHHGISPLGCPLHRS